MNVKHSWKHRGREKMSANDEKEKCFSHGGFFCSPLFPPSPWHIATFRLFFLFFPLPSSYCTSHQFGLGIWNPWDILIIISFLHRSSALLIRTLWCALAIINVLHTHAAQTEPLSIHNKYCWSVLCSPFRFVNIFFFRLCNNWKKNRITTTLNTGKKCIFASKIVVIWFIYMCIRYFSCCPPASMLSECMAAISAHDLFLMCHPCITKR